MRSFHKIIGGIVVALALCTITEAECKEVKPQHVISIQQDDIMLPFKVSYVVTLDKRISEGEIEKIAHKIKGNAPSAKRLFITYYLRGMEIGAGAWATSHYAPTLNIHILEFATQSNLPDPDLRLTP